MGTVGKESTADLWNCSHFWGTCLQSHRVYCASARSLSPRLPEALANANNHALSTKRHCKQVLFLQNICSGMDQVAFSLGPVLRRYTFCSWTVQFQSTLLACCKKGTQRMRGSSAAARRYAGADISQHLLRRVCIRPSKQSGQNLLQQ